MYHESNLVTFFFKMMNLNTRHFYGLGASNSCIHKNRTSSERSLGITFLGTGCKDVNQI